MEVHDGYAGSILEIDLTNQIASRIPLPAHYRSRLLSGKSLAAQIMLECMTGEERAFSADNLLVVAASVLTGTGAPGAVRFDVAALSPKDDLPAFSNCGGHFGLYMKQAGYDALVLKGKCGRPTWLEIGGDGVFFHDAADLWGLGTGACRAELEAKRDGSPFGSLCIGPAGEHLVSFASLMADGHSTGRAGFGAVLGWKQVKAIAVSGNRKIPFHDADAASEVNRQWYAQLRKAASENRSPEFCTACPLHCARHRRNENPLLEELGMDAIAAEAAAQGVADPDLYRAIAFRQGAGDQLAEGGNLPKGKTGKRRNIRCERLAEALGLEADETDSCRDYTEAISTLGQCMFTVNGLMPGMGEAPILLMLRSITGRQLCLRELLDIGRNSRELEQRVKNRFK